MKNLSIFNLLRGSVKAKIIYILISLEFAVKTAPGESYGLRCGQGYIYSATRPRNQSANTDTTMAKWLCRAGEVYIKFLISGLPNKRSTFQ